jgi:hypothetical protein
LEAVALMERDRSRIGGLKERWQTIRIDDRRALPQQLTTESVRSVEK